MTYKRDNKMNKKNAIKKLIKSIKNKKLEEDIDIIQFLWFDRGCGDTSWRLRKLMGNFHEYKKVNINDVICKEIYVLRCNPLGNDYCDKYDYFLTFDDKNKPRLLGGLDFKYPNTSDFKGLKLFFDYYTKIDDHINANASYSVIFDYVML